MRKRVIGQFGRLALWFLPFAIAVAGCVVAMPWVKQHNPVLATILGTVGAIFVMGYSLFMASMVLRWQRRLDEVQIASQGFANSYGWVWGGVAAGLLLMVPPVAELAGRPGERDGECTRQQLRATWPITARCRWRFSTASPSPW